MGALGFALSGVGLVLVWAGVKGEDLREVVTGVFSGRRRFRESSAPSSTAAPPAARSYAGTPTTANPFGPRTTAGATTATNPYPVAPSGSADPGRLL